MKIGILIKLQSKVVKPVSLISLASGQALRLTAGAAVRGPLPTHQILSGNRHQVSSINKYARHTSYPPSITRHPVSLSCISSDPPIHTEQWPP
jgi:hypothetical protein